MIEELGLTVVGSYSRPSDAQGSYTSLFIFVCARLYRSAARRSRSSPASAAGSATTAS